MPVLFQDHHGSRFIEDTQILRQLYLQNMLVQKYTCEPLSPELHMGRKKVEESLQNILFSF
jgi:hypothetical protein